MAMYQSPWPVRPSWAGEPRVPEPSTRPKARVTPQAGPQERPRPPPPGRPGGSALPTPGPGAAPCLTVKGEPEGLRLEACLLGTGMRALPSDSALRTLLLCPPPTTHPQVHTPAGNLVRARWRLGSERVPQPAWRGSWGWDGDHGRTPRRPHRSFASGCLSEWTSRTPGSSAQLLVVGPSQEEQRRISPEFSNSATSQLQESLEEQEAQTQMLQGDGALSLAIISCEHGGKV